MTTPSQPLMPVLRRALDQIEPLALVYDQQPDGARRFLALLDEISRLAEACRDQGLDIESEQVRVDAVVGRARREAERFARAHAGIAIPAERRHGQTLMTLAAQRRTEKRKRLVISTSLVTLIITVLVYMVVSAPPSPNTSRILELAVSGASAEAYALAQKEHEAFPDDAETLLWLSVLAEVNNDATRAEMLWQSLQRTVDNPDALLYQRGNTRLLALNLTKAAEDAALLKQNPITYPEGVLLEAGIAEARGEVTKAITLFGEAARVAEAANRQEMAVLARVRMGNLMQYGIDATITPSP